jgi:membrane-associated phospholipid phosphatase
VNGASVVSVAARSREPGRVRFRPGLVGPAVYGVLLSVLIIVEGVPVSRGRILVCVVLGLLAFSLTNVRGWARGVVLEWLPFALILSAYDLMRGQADTLLYSAHMRPQIRADEVLFLGTVPTVWLQERLWQGSENLQWYDYGACLVYASYFVTTYLVAAFLWVFARGLFRRFVAMVSLLALMGLATYALFPAAPPWLASQSGQLDATTRSIAVIWGEIPMVHVNRLFAEGSQYSNPVAAVPSLHAAYTMLITVFLWRLAPRWGRLPLAVYPWAMAFALVYTAEHYAVDIVLGWIYALAAFWTVNRLAERLGRGRRAPPRAFIWHEAR